MTTREYMLKRIERIIRQHALTTRDVLTVAIFLTGHRDKSFLMALVDYVEGIGSAAIAAGRAKVRAA